VVSWGRERKNLKLPPKSAKKQIAKGSKAPYISINISSMAHFGWGCQDKKQSGVPRSAGQGLGKPRGGVGLPAERLESRVRRWDSGGPG